MKINVYLSSSLRESDTAFDSLTASLRTLHLEPVSVSRNELETGNLLKGVEDRMRRCLGAIVVGSSTHPTSWNQLEAGMAIALGLPLLVILEERGGLAAVSRTVNKVIGPMFGTVGELDRIFGQNSLVYQARLKDPDWAKSEQVQWLLAELKKNIKKRFVGGERGNDAAEPANRAVINRAVTVTEPLEAALVPASQQIIGTAPNDADVWVVTHKPGANEYYVLGPTKSVDGVWNLTVDVSGTPKFRTADPWIELPQLDFSRGVIELRALVHPTEPLTPGSLYGWPEVRNGEGSSSTTRFVIKT